MKKSLVAMVLVLVGASAANAYPFWHHRPPPPPRHYRPLPPPFPGRGGDHGGDRGHGRR